MRCTSPTRSGASTRLDLATGAEHSGWPVAVYSDFRRELVWGALTLVDGSIYLGTGSYCDRKMIGKVFRVELATRAVSHWVAVPSRLGGGGSVWGWGGLAYSATRDSLYAVTGNAFEGGTNSGKRFREYAGHGEQIVELSRDLRVLGSNHPRDIHQKTDLDFVGSPVLFRHAACGQLAAGLNKNGFLYVWRLQRLAAGPLVTLRLSKPTLAAPLLTQAAYSPRTGALYVSTPSRLVRVDLDRRCRGRVKWGRKVGSGLFNGSPTIAGDTVWLVENAFEGSALVGVRAGSGVVKYKAKLGGPGLRRADCRRRPHLRPDVQRRLAELRARVGAETRAGRGGQRALRVPKLLGRLASLGQPRGRRLHDRRRRRLVAADLPRSAVRVAAGLGDERNDRGRRPQLGLRLPTGPPLDGRRGRDLGAHAEGGRHRVRCGERDTLVVARRDACRWLRGLRARAASRP